MSTRTTTALALSCGLVVLGSLALNWATVRRLAVYAERIDELIQQTQEVLELMTPTKAETTIDCPRLGSNVKTTVTSYKGESESAAAFAARHIEEVEAMQTACQVQ